jgi:hypothetical protein
VTVRLTVRTIAALACVSAAVGCGNADAKSTDDQPQQQVSAAKLQVSAAPANCGGTGQPDCPLQNWMKATLQSYQKANNYGRLARAFDDLAAHAPANYERWQDLASRGAEAARNQDDAAVRAACKTCHDEHRARYRRERRAEKFM